jgi:DNA-binding NarL/FixJ family response regulator
MRPLRTVTVTITPLLGDIISQVVAEHAPIDVVSRLDSRDQLELRLPTLAPDLVLVGLRKGESGAIALALRSAVPRAKVVALSHDGHHAYLPAPRRHGTKLIDLSPTALIETIQGL